MTDTFRCTSASVDDAEPMAGSAPTEQAWLCVEHAGPWGRKALAETRLPEAVRDRLADLPGVRVVLVRRHGGASGPGIRVFAGWLGAGEHWLETTVLSDAEQLLDLDLDGLAAGRRPGLTAYDGLVWLVCTNGRRDRCCAEIGRPVTAALAARWPEETWETTHLGGHRFAGTLVALPSGVCLGRLDPDTAVSSCQDIVAGRHPAEHSRGRTGLPAEAQAAELAVRARTGDQRLGSVVVDGVSGAMVSGTVGPRSWRAQVVAEPGAERRQSCADLALKPRVSHRVVSVAIEH